MSNKAYWESQYDSGFSEWDVDNADPSLMDTVKTFDIKPCKTLEVGCGTGTNSIWLASNWFDVLGIDISDNAIARARKKSASSGVNCEFITAEFLRDDIPGKPFQFIFDRGCFHIFDSPSDRSLFAFKVFSCLEESGIWLSLVGSKKGFPSFPGPPRRSKSDITEAVEPYFDILSLSTGYFERKHRKPAHNYVCLMKRKSNVLKGG